ncbi:hypothetical protein [Vibrio mimicus]|uniref:hypothetical protein n=1 Tax=Vibrio mimicus TaxID=674 RepID=UPI0021CBD064|nr:hypothetical protein [Vibrio mimicus]
MARTILADPGIDYLVAETLLNHAKGKLDGFLLSVILLQYHSIDAVLNYKAYEEVKDDINTQIKSYRKSKIIAIKPKEEKKVA